MKIALVERSDGDVVLVEVDQEGGKLTVVDGATPDDLIDVLRKGDRWSARGETIALSAEVRFLPPVARPSSLRDFMAYEAHLKNSLGGLGQEVNPSWYEEPVFYFSNPNAIIGPEDVVKRPRGSTKMDYESELAAIIGMTVSDVDAEDPNALDSIAGFTLMNDWSARDLSAKEMRHFMGPVKGKDFATSLGPWVVTPDEFDVSTGSIDERVVVRVNGETYTDNTFANMTFPWPRIIEKASANTQLVPGDVIGSGTVGFGCLLELRTKNKALGEEKYTFLSDGDVVELESPKLGVLRNVIAS